MIRLRNAYRRSARVNTVGMRFQKFWSLYQSSGTLITVFYTVVFQVEALNTIHLILGAFCSWHVYVLLCLLVRMSAYTVKSIARVSINHKKRACGTCVPSFITRMEINRHCKDKQQILNAHCKISTTTILFRLNLEL